VRSYQITVNGQEYAVQIDNPDSSPVTVQVNGRVFRVTVREPSSAAVSRAPSAADDIDMPDIYVPTVAATYIETAPEQQAETNALTAQAPAEGMLKVTAPMPGRIMDVVVHVGDRVKHGDTLCSLEAMKMKSPIRATSDGVVAQVLANEGQSVSYGDVLFTLR
jgi:biotin carboxyl carrier protein